jgi:hypothetical protein
LTLILDLTLDDTLAFPLDISSTILNTSGVNIDATVSDSFRPSKFVSSYQLGTGKTSYQVCDVVDRLVFSYEIWFRKDQEGTSNQASFVCLQ